MKEYFSIAEEIENSKKYDAVYLTTFNFEVAFFERYLLHLFLNNGIRHINLFVDTEQLNESLKEELPMHFGRKYYVSPVSVGGVFHPKVILMLGDRRAKIIVSSANIKMSGYMTNNEIFSTFSYDENNKEHEGLVYECIEMFRKLNSLTPVPDMTTMKMLEKFPVKKPETYGSCRLIENTDTSIIYQLQEMLPGNVDQIRVAVPFYDENLSALQYLKDTFHCNNVQLFIQNEMNTFPVDYNDENDIIPNHAIIAFSEVNAGSKVKSTFYHGKVFEFECGEHTYVLYGSANCTVSALLRSTANGGNVECDLFEEKESSEPSFFESFKKLENIKLSNCSFSISESEVIPYHFFYSLLDKEILRVYIKYDVKPDHLFIRIGNHSINYIIENDLITLDIPIMILDELNSIFDLQIHEGQADYSLRGWYINRMKLEYFRKNIGAMHFNEQFDEGDPDQFSDYMSAVFDALFNDEWDEFVADYKASVSVKYSEVSDDESEEEQQLEEDSADFMLDKDISDKYVERNTMFAAAYESSKKYASRFYGLLQTKNKHSSTGIIRTTDGSEHEKVPRHATAADKKLASYIRRNIKRHFLFKDTSFLSYDYYVHLCGIILYVIHKMKYQEKIIDFMSDDEVIKIKCLFSDLLMDKFSSEQNEDDQKLLINLILMTVIELGTHHEHDKNEIAKKLIQKLNQLVNIRESYRDLIADLNLSLIIDKNTPFGALKYVAGLFGYKTKAELNEYLNEIYHGKCLIRQSPTVLEIEITSKAPEAIADNMIMEVVKYLNEYDKDVKMIIFNYAPIDGKNVSYQVRFAGLHINKVFKRYNRPNGILEYKCVKADKNWKPVYFSS